MDQNGREIKGSHRSEYLPMVPVNFSTFDTQILLKKNSKLKKKRGI